MMTRVSEIMNRAVTFANRGDFAGARAQAQQLLPAQKDNPAILQFLGVVCCQAGDRVTGLNYLRAAFAKSPGDTTLLLNLVRALIDADELEEAERLADPRTQNAPVERLTAYAEVLKKREQHGRAAKVLRAVVERSPDHFEAWNNLGTTLLSAGRAADAIEALTKAAELAPSAAQIHINLARALGLAERHDERLAAAQKAVEMGPRDPLAALELGRALHELNRSAEAIPHFTRFVQHDPTKAEGFVAIGMAFANLGEIGRAEQSYTMALKADPAPSQAYVNLGILLEQGNRLDELDSLIGSATSLGCNEDSLLFLRATSRRRKGELPEALRLAELIRPGEVDDTLRTQLIGQLADRLNKTDLAYAAFVEMNETIGAQAIAAGFDGTEHRQYVERLARFTTPDWFASWQSVDFPDQRASPVFLVGFPRSGTTLLDTMLMGHPSVVVLEEEPLLATIRDEVGDLNRLPEVGTDEANWLRSKYFKGVDALVPGAAGKMVIDKLPLNILRTPLIHRLFPNAKIIFAQRHPCDVVLSCFMQSFKINQAMASFLTLKNAARLYDAVMSYWIQCRGIFPLDVHTICYESLVHDRETELRLLVDFLGLSWDAGLLDHQETAGNRGYIRTPSYAQVTERIYSRAQGRWERYRDHMQDVLPVLAPWANYFGYSRAPEDEVDRTRG